MLAFKSQLALSSRLLGFKSRCNTLAVWMNLSPRRIWIKKRQEHGQASSLSGTFAAFQPAIHHSAMTP
jgi:hypothetical protein